MTDPELDDYPMITENGIQCCPYCGEEHHPPIHPIISEDGDRYEDPLNTSPGTAWYCPDCWKERQDEIAADGHKTLDKYT